MKNTKNFKRAEFTCPCCGKEKMKQEAIDFLQGFRDWIDQPIYISKGGGYRCEKYNAELVKRNPLASKNSRHKYGDAFDMRVHGMTTEELTEKAMHYGFDGIGIYDTHVHGDKRGSKARWDSRKNKNAQHPMILWKEEPKQEEPKDEVRENEEPEVTIKEIIQEPPEPTQLEEEYKKDLEIEETKKNVEVQENKTQQNGTDEELPVKEDTKAEEEIEVKPAGFKSQIGQFSNLMTLFLTVIVGGMHILEIPVNEQMENLWFMLMGKTLGGEGWQMLTSKMKKK